MAADTMNRDARCNRAIAIMKMNATGENPPYHLADMFGGKGKSKMRMAHARAGDVAHLRLLDMKGRIGELF